MSAPTQRDRVLHALEHAGSRGITAASFLPPSTVDDRPPILRLAARIDDLRRAGHRIETTIVAAGGGARVARYVLAAGADHVVTTPSPAEPAPEQASFDVGEVARRPLSHYAPEMA